VTLLPEATSGRAIRALGRFFGIAARDDVLLVYFSGHGKLDQSGRLHLCMQDTESTDLLSTSVSSARINEFADASHARNVVIVLDCCHAGAFRGADLGDAVAGPGRYVLTSCRGTQLANDATVENGTSFFTQHLVDGLVGAAADQDEDGYVTFSDLYAYVGRQLREAGKQIPQRRVDGDGDVPLAKRPLPAPAEVTAAVQPPPEYTETIRPGQPQEGGPGSPPDSTVTDQGTTVQDSTPAPGRPRTGRARRGVLLAAAAAAAVIAGGVIAALVLLIGGSGGNSGSNANVGASTGTHVAKGPWRLRIEDFGYGDGCSITLTDAHGEQILRKDSLYSPAVFQIWQAGSFKWTRNSRLCNVVALDGSGMWKLPFTYDQGGDSPAFVAPPQGVAVHVKNYHSGQRCDFTLNDPANGQQLDFETATPGKKDTVKLDAGGRRTVYLGLDSCGVKVFPAG
jgi:hypothetical protein